MEEPGPSNFGDYADANSSIDVKTIIRTFEKKDRSPTKLRSSANLPQTHLVDKVIQAYELKIKTNTDVADIEVKVTRNQDPEKRRSMLGSNPFVRNIVKSDVAWYFGSGVSLDVTPPQEQNLDKDDIEPIKRSWPLKKTAHGNDYWKRHPKSGLSRSGNLGSSQDLKSSSEDAASSLMCLQEANKNSNNILEYNEESYQGHSLSSDTNSSADDAEDMWPKNAMNKELDEIFAANKKAHRKTKSKKYHSTEDEIRVYSVKDDTRPKIIGATLKEPIVMGGTTIKFIQLSEKNRHLPQRSALVNLLGAALDKKDKSERTSGSRLLGLKMYGDCIDEFNSSDVDFIKTLLQNEEDAVPEPTRKTTSTKPKAIQGAQNQTISDLGPTNRFQLMTMSLHATNENERVEKELKIIDRSETSDPMEQINKALGQTKLFEESDDSISPELESSFCPLQTSSTRLPRKSFRYQPQLSGIIDTSPKSSSSPSYEASSSKKQHYVKSNGYWPQSDSSEIFHKSTSPEPISLSSSSQADSHNIRRKPGKHCKPRISKSGRSLPYMSQTNSPETSSTSSNLFLPRAISPILPNSFDSPHFPEPPTPPPTDEPTLPTSSDLPPDRSDSVDECYSLPKLQKHPRMFKIQKHSFVSLAKDEDLEEPVETVDNACKANFYIGDDEVSNDEPSCSSNCDKKFLSKSENDLSSLNESNVETMDNVSRLGSNEIEVRSSINLTESVLRVLRHSSYF